MGNMPDWGALSEVAASNGVTLIEDAAESIGSRGSDAWLGRLATRARSVFTASKTLTTGEGGMLTTDSDEIHARCRSSADHGRVPGDVSFQNTEGPLFF